MIRPDSGEQPEAVVPARHRLADDIRNLMSAAVLTTADDQRVSDAAAMVRSATEALLAQHRSSRYDGVPGLAPHADTNQLIWETHGAFGGSNPLAPPVVAREAPGRLEATVGFGPAWEGGPGLVYGGSIASAFDGLLGRTALSAGHLAVTKTLSVRFLAPTPLTGPLRMDSSVDEVDGRRIRVTGQMRAGGNVTAEASADFVVVDPSHYRMSNDG